MEDLEGPQMHRRDHLVLLCPLEDQGQTLGLLPFPGWEEG